MKLSHSKLSTILTCPMTYYLNYKQKIRPKVKSSALSIGSAVHWGIEHDTEDLSDYYKEEGSFQQRDNYTRDQVLAEGMVHGYLLRKDELMNEILTVNGEKLELLDTSHEIAFEAKLKTNLKEREDHIFEGIIDLLLLTDRGFIIIDYKTSSTVPDWDKYLDQIYRYIFLLKQAFPDTPVVKIGIINLRKTTIRQKVNENNLQFLQRMKLEYELESKDMVNYHEFMPDSLDPKLIDNYINNLSKMADMAQIIDENQTWYINFANANGVYGKSQYWDIFYHTPGAEVLYSIEDDIWNEDDQEFQTTRDCRELDLMTIDRDDVLNKYEQYKSYRQDLQLDDLSVEDSVEFMYDLLKEFYQLDLDLLKIYEITYRRYKDEG